MPELSDPCWFSGFESLDHYQLNPIQRSCGESIFEIDCSVPENSNSMLEAGIRDDLRKPRVDEHHPYP